MIFVVVSDISPFVVMFFEVLIAVGINSILGILVSLYCSSCEKYENQIMKIFFFLAKSDFLLIYLV